MKSSLIRHQAGQKGSNLWENDQYNRNDNQGRKEGQYPLEDSLKGHLRGNPLDDKYIYPYRRCDYSHLGYEHNYDPKPDRVKAELHNYRKEDGDGNHDEGHRVHKETTYEINENDDHQNNHGGHRKPPQPISQLEGYR